MNLSYYSKKLHSFFTPLVLVLVLDVNLISLHWFCICFIYLLSIYFDLLPVHFFSYFSFFRKFLIRTIEIHTVLATRKENVVYIFNYLSYQKRVWVIYHIVAFLSSIQADCNGSIDLNFFLFWLNFSFFLLLFFGIVSNFFYIDLILKFNWNLKCGKFYSILMGNYAYSIHKLIK